MTPEQAKEIQIGDRIVSIFETGNLAIGERVILIEKHPYDYGFFAKKNGVIVGTNIQHFYLPTQ